MKKLYLIFVLIVLLSGCSVSEYEGMTASEWADEYYSVKKEYQEFRNCVEDYDNLSFEEKK